MVKLYRKEEYEMKSCPGQIYMNQKLVARKRQEKTKVGQKCPLLDFCMHWMYNLTNHSPKFMDETPFKLLYQENNTNTKEGHVLIYIYIISDPK